MTTMGVSEGQERVLLLSKIVNEMPKKRGRSANNNNHEMANYNQKSKKSPAGPQNPPPIAVARRNARERNRVKQVNNGFSNLRQHIPHHVAQCYGDKGKKLSKVETLRMAVEYIKGLQRLIAEADGVVGGPELCELKREIEMDDPDDNSNDDSSRYSLMIDDNQEQQLIERHTPEMQCKTKSSRDSCDTSAKMANNRLWENQNRRNRRNSSGGPFYNNNNNNKNTTANNNSQRQVPLSFGDEENIEPVPLVATKIEPDNNNEDTAAQQILANGPQFSPVLIQQVPSPRIVILKRDLPCHDFESEMKNSPEHQPHIHHHPLESAYGLPTGAQIVQPAENSKLIVIEDAASLPIQQSHHPVMVAVNDHQTTTHQYIYLTNSPDATAGQLFYDTNGDVKQVEEAGTEYMDYVNWFEQQEQQGRLTHLGAQRMTHV